MTKAILVIDVPNEYKDKDLVIVGDYLRLGYVDGHCIKEIEELDTEVLHLKELPQKKEYIALRIDDAFELVGSNAMRIQVGNVYIDGFNACLEEILGEIEND